MLNKIKMYHFIFDIDGTLLHTSGSGKQAFLTALEEILNIKIDKNKISFIGGVDLKIFNKILKDNNINFSLKLWNEFKKLYLIKLEKEYEIHGKNWIIFKDVKNLLNFLKNKNKNLYIATGNINEGAKLKLQLMGLDNYFLNIFGCEYETERKDILNKAINYILYYQDINLKQKNNIENNNFYSNIKTNYKSSICFIGDALSDETAAKLLKINFFGVDNLNKFSFLKPYWFRNIESLFKFLKLNL